MAATGLGRAARRKLMGLAMLVVIAALVSLSIVIYNKALPWQNVVQVNLQAERIGHQLIVPADVKIRGLIVGEVRAVGTNGKYAVLKMAIQPNKANLIPANVQARILPKTLFGEKYVDLIVPSNPSPQHIKAGDVITEDRSETAIEIEKVFDDLVPMLRTLKPTELNLMLSSLAGALRGRGDKLGENFVNTETYLAKFNPHIPTLMEDISGLADFASNTNQAAPGLLATLRNFAANARTLVEKRDSFTKVLQGTSGFADTANAVLRQNAQNLIALADVSVPTLTTLARYSPEFPCLITGIDRIEPLLESTFAPVQGSSPGLHIRLEVIAQPGGYTWPADKPTYDQDIGPNCHGLPGAPRNTPFGSPSTSAAQSGGVGSGSEKSTVAALVAPVLGVPAQNVDSSLADLLAGPVLRGAAVSYR